jgi:hypothetical protein
MSKAVFEDRVTRATVADPSLKSKRQLQAALGTIDKQDKKIKKLKARVTLMEEELAETKALRREIKRMEKAVDTQKASNRILLEIARDREVVNIQQVFTRTGPPESASKVTHQLRELFMGKISEERSRTSEVVGLMSGLAEKITTLSASLRSEIQTGLATRKALRKAKRDSKALSKVVADADVAAALDGVRNKFKEALRRREFYMNNASVRQTFTLMETEKKPSRSSLNNERRQAGPEQSTINALKLASCDRIVELSNDASDKNGINISSTTVKAYFKKTDSFEDIYLTAADLPVDKSAQSGFNNILLHFEYLKTLLRLYREFCVQEGRDIYTLPHPSNMMLEKMAEGCVNMSDHANTALGKYRYRLVSLTSYL